MITRRSFVFTGATGLFVTAAQGALADPPSPNDPVAIINSIYARAAKGKGDGGGAFIIENRTAKAKYLSKSLIALWAKADAHTPKGDVGPVDFDPVTNSQEPDVKSFAVTSEKSDAATAVIAVTITGHNPPAPMRPTPSSTTISCATAATGRSTIFAAPTTASPGRSGAC